MVVAGNLLLTGQARYFGRQCLLNKDFSNFFGKCIKNFLKNLKFLQNNLRKLTQILRKSTKVIKLFNYFCEITTDYIKI